MTNLETGASFEERYDKLILSHGAKPTQPRLPGMGIDRLFTLRTVEDTLRIKAFIDENQPKSAVLTGDGFIGVQQKNLSRNNKKICHGVLTLCLPLCYNIRR